MRLALAILVVAACAKTQTVQCEDGRTCPANSACDELHHGCVDPEQLRTCVGRDQGADCLILAQTPGLCRDEICLLAGCGDGFRRDPEVCDGAELGVKNNCTDFEFYDSLELPCNSACGYDFSSCTGRCGDGMVNGPELCDGAPPPKSCVDFGYGAGFLGCSQCGPGLQECKVIGWQLEYSSGTALLDAHGTSDDNVYVVGGVLVHYDGVAWSNLDTSGCLPGGGNFIGIWALAQDDAIAVGLAGSEPFMLHVTATGCTKQVITTMQTPSVSRVWATSANDVYVVGNGIHHFNGTTWTASNIGLQLNRIWGSGPGDVYAGGVTALLHGSGSTFSALTIPGVLLGEVTALGGTSASDVYVGVREQNGTTNSLSRFNGATWTIILANASGEIRAFGSGGGRIFIAPAPYIHTYDGSEWTELGANPQFAGWAEGLWVSPSGKLFAATIPAGVIATYPGAAWVDDSLGAGVSVERVSVRSSNEAVALTNGDVVNRWNGLVWTNDSNTPGSGRDIWIDPSDGDTYLLTDAGLWRRPRLGGWPGTAEPSSPSGQTLYARTATDMWILADAQQTQLRHWDGAQVTCTTCVAPHQISALWGSAADNVFAVGLEGMILRWNGSAWAPMTSGTTVSLNAIWGSGPNDVYTAGNGGTVLHFDGTSWNPVSVVAGLTFTSVTGLGPDDVFLGGTTGFLYHFDGTHWSPVRRQTNGFLRRLAAAGDTLFVAEDGGIIRRLMRTLPW